MKKNSPNTSRVSKLVKLMPAGPVEDLIQAIKEDHYDLKDLIAIMKREDAKPAEKKTAAASFMNLLKSHSTSEEKALYEKCLKVKALRSHADEGYVEHEIADRLMKAIATSTNQDRWLAQIKALAEVVEHHIEEEESKFLPEVEKHFAQGAQDAMAHQFVLLRKRSQKRFTDDNAGVLRAAS